LKLHLHHFSRRKIQKESQNRRNQGFSYYFCMMRILEAQKHVDPDSDPDPQHWFKFSIPCLRTEAVYFPVFIIVIFLHGRLTEVYPRLDLRWRTEWRELIRYIPDSSCFDPCWFQCGSGSALPAHSSVSLLPDPVPGVPNHGGSRRIQIRKTGRFYIKTEVFSAFFAKYLVLL
jgi:hypothetical protein